MRDDDQQAWRMAMGFAAQNSAALDLARQAMGPTGTLRAEMEALALRDQALTAAVMGVRSPYDTIAKAVAAHDNFKARLAGVSFTGKPHDPYEGLAHTTARRIHEEIARAQESMLGIGGTIGRALQFEQQRDLLATAERNARWARGLLGAQEEIERLLGVGSRSALSTTLSAARSIADQVAGFDRPFGISERAATLAAQGALHDTMAKMSAFTGALGLTGPISQATGLSIDALLGHWRTLPDLPPGYWRDRDVRTRLYRDAEVDPGLIEADPGDVIDIVVGSGMAEGGLTRAGATVAIVPVGPIEVRITASRSKSRTFEMIDAFERELKSFVDAVLTELYGPEWFKQCFDAEAVDRAKEKRQAAQRAGEPWQPLIWFLDLGPLIGLVIRKANWPSFERYFGDKQIFDVNLRQLMTIRNPTMHARGTDHIQMIEAMVFINKFNVAMGRTEAIDEGWDSDI